MSEPTFSFNLWTQPWIRVTRRDGDDAHLSIGECLSNAHELAALSDPSPLVVAGTHRLLTAILQSIYIPRDLNAIVEILHAGRFDQSRLADFAAQYLERFDLFHPTTPFLQTGDVPLDGWKKPDRGTKHEWADPKPIAVLFAEVPAETNRSHFYHVTDEAHALCPACCARGIITIPSFASSGGAGIRPSINGVPPIYVLPAGATLFGSLALSLTTPDFQPPAAAPMRAEDTLWNGDARVEEGRQVGAVGYLESLTFPARRMRLYPHRVRADCTLCGTPTESIVRSLLFEMGHWLGEESALWEDPFAAFRLPRGKGKAAEVGLKPVRPDEGKALWREYNGLLLAEREDVHRPRVVQQIARLVDRDAVRSEHNLRFRCIGIRTDGKAKNFEWIDEALEVPPAILLDEAAAYTTETALARADEVRFVLESSFNSHFRPERDRGGRDEKLARFKSIRARMITTYWQQLAPQFRRFINDLATEATRDEVERSWVGTLHVTGKEVFTVASEQVGERANALRAQVEAQSTCFIRLAKKRKEWFGEQ